ncbi:MAG: DegT/DnrJ/EryC1/StrS family aminotransferase [Polyangiaceae bacterium]|nr:DegT/DnrJ/EryC1/StrS family aminotransferase [Polyangiaceae bacterium]
MSRAGHRLPEGNDVQCPVTRERYRIDGEVCNPVSDEPPPEKIPLQDIAAETKFFEPKLRAAFDRVLAGGVFIMGSEVTALERSMTDLLHVEHAVGVSSGTDALLVSLMALGIGPGDEVITTPLSFFATVGAILRLGAKPVFADIDLATQNIDPERVRQAITDKTKAILPVHLFGRPVDLKVFDIAAERGIPVVEDAAQALGATTDRGHVGGLGTIGCFSFFPTKNLGALGDGGLVVTNDAKLAERVRLLRAHGAKPKYHHVALGGNFRLDALQAAFLREKLPYLEELTERRRVNAAAYREGLGELEAEGRIVLPPEHPGHVFHQYVVRTARRDEVKATLAEVGVETAVYYPEPLHRMPVFGTAQAGDDMTNAQKTCRENLALPINPWLTAIGLRRIVNQLRIDLADSD